MQRTKHTKRTQRGFTLTEMAIVVVLGGILLGAGLMAGRGQISRAQAQDVIQIVGDLQTASASFKQRYGYLPGDWPYVANVIPGVASGGNGDGLITGAISAAGLATGATSEVALAPVHLYQAGMLGRLGTNAQQRIQSQFGPVQIAQSTAANNNATYPGAFPAVKNVIVFYNLPCEVVLDVDRALDDGDGATGKAQTNFAPAVCPPGGTAARFFVPL